MHVNFHKDWSNEAYRIIVPDYIKPSVVTFIHTPISPKTKPANLQLTTLTPNADSLPNCHFCPRLTASCSPSSVKKSQFQTKKPQSDQAMNTTVLYALDSLSSLYPNFQ